MAENNTPEAPEILDGRDKKVEIYYADLAQRVGQITTKTIVKGDK